MKPLTPYWNQITVHFLVITIALITPALAKQRAKSVTTLLESKWQQTPLMLEVAEYLADENPSYFWGYVDGICEFDEGFVNYKTDFEKYEFILSEASRFISPAQITLLKFALSLRAYSPTIEMYHQIALDRDLPPDCSAVVDINGNLTCDPETVEDLINKVFDHPDMFEVDHHYPGSENKSVGVVLYGELGTDAFRLFHTTLKKLAEEGRIDYVLRHYVENRDTSHVRLSGYGVELQIKSTEYKAQDDTKVKSDTSSGEDEENEEEDEVEGFRFGKLKTLYPDQKKELELLRLQLLESTNEMAPLKVWQLQELSLQAAQRIVSAPAETAINVMMQIAQNFPIQARSLVNSPVSEALRDEIKANQDLFAATLSVQAADGALFINGMYFDADFLDMFSLLEVLRQEQKILEGLHKIGIPESQLAKLLALDFSSNSQEYAVDIRDSAIMYVNDIDTDKRYKRWPGSVMEMLRPSFPGTLKLVRKNIYHLTLILDPSAEVSQPLLKLAESFVVHNIPIRVGIVFSVNSDPKVNGMKDPGVAMLNAFNFVLEQESERYQALSFLTDVYASSGDAQITAEKVHQMLRTRYTNLDTEDVFGDDSEYDIGRQLAKDYVQRTGLNRKPQVLLNGVPLSEKDTTKDTFEEAVLTGIMNQMFSIQRAVFKGDLTDNDIPVDYIMNQPNVMPRLNDRILHGSTEYLDLTGDAPLKLNWSTFSSFTSTEMSSTILHYLPVLTRKGNVNSAFRPFTVWVVADVEEEKGRELIAAAVEHMKGTNSIRLGVIFNPSSPTGSSLLTQAVYAALNMKDSDSSRAVVYKLLQNDVAVAIQQGKVEIKNIQVKDVDMSSFATDVAKQMKTMNFLNAHRSYVQKVLHVSPGQRLIVCNGKVIGPLNEDEEFTSDDFNLLERFSASTYADKLNLELQGLDTWGAENGSNANSILSVQVASLLLSRSQSKTRYDIVFRGDEHSVVTLPPRIPGQPSFDLIAIVDPLTRGAQKISSLLYVLQDVVNCRIRIFLNCVEKHSEMPLRSFYRFVLEPELEFSSGGSLSPSAVARFHNMPVSPLFTQNIHVPENWLVEVVRAVHDLDNIKLEDVDGLVVHSEFELAHLLLEGHCFEQSSGNPPRGLQITLGTNHNPVEVDTIVMANLGYLQLKANPGAWVLRLRQGRSAEVYDIVSHENTDTPRGSEDIKVVIHNFQSHSVKLKVGKKPGKEHSDVLYEDEETNGGLWNTITSPFSGSKSGVDDEDDVLNIFSLASGHLYERFLRIMMLSVLKHTKTPVKFWFLKNYLSPSLTDFLPQMSEKYGFKYELVEYKWPRWLHQQTEKQRIIWGYKILFLDVLFPLSVKKIIFVDADQVVRADLKELRDLDLNGAPYGYTPFCESRKEMDGFRFWKSGYWRSHLQMRSYHISALYVVDLKRFRRVAAGDRLRGQYQALSQDPNSLANLDQDLPNNMIHQVAIKSLPQEWLWCETWCDEQSKKHAKTIDLCNNPLTKEAKLSAAVRIISEWTDYDQEIKRLQEEINNKSRIDEEVIQERKEERRKIEDNTIDTGGKESLGHEHGEL